MFIFLLTLNIFNVLILSLYSKTPLIYHHHQDWGYGWIIRIYRHFLNFKQVLIHSFFSITFQNSGKVNKKKLVNLQLILK